MIDLYTSPTPNGYKASVTLEELGLPYEVHAIDLSKNVQKEPWFLAINPNGRIPAIVDRDFTPPLAVFESGAIMIHLAEKTGRLLPTDPLRRFNVIKWLFWQTSSQGPLLGQAAHFVSHAASRGIDAQYAVDRYRREACRLYGVLETQLVGRDYIDDEFSIADIAAFPWVRVAKGQGVNLDEFPNVKRWCAGVAQRPSARRKLERDDATKQAAKSNYYADETWNLLFGGHSPNRSVAP